MTLRNARCNNKDRYLLISDGPSLDTGARQKPCNYTCCLHRELPVRTKISDMLCCPVDRLLLNNASHGRTRLQTNSISSNLPERYHLRFPLRVNEVIALLWYCATLIGSLLPTFRDKFSVPSLRVKQSKKNEKTQKPIKRAFWSREYLMVLNMCGV